MLWGPLSLGYLSFLKKLPLVHTHANFIFLICKNGGTDELLNQLLAYGTHLFTRASLSVTHGENIIASSPSYVFAWIHIHNGCPNLVGKFDDEKGKNYFFDLTKSARILTLVVDYPTTWTSELDYIYPRSCTTVFMWYAFYMYVFLPLYSQRTSQLFYRLPLP